MILNDTIAAISTPVGYGGISIVRLSGKDAISIADNIFIGKVKPSSISNRNIIYGKIFDPEDNRIIDDVLLIVMKGPRTYTGDDMVEINCHGGVLITKKILEILLTYGARLAEPGEFTKRAFLSGRIDLAQAEAVMEVVFAKTDTELKLAVSQLEGNLSSQITEIKELLLQFLSLIEASVDFPEDVGVDRKEFGTHLHKVLSRIEHLLRTADEGRLLREGAKVSIVGRTNVGKSSILNALLSEERAIVTPIPGTTRDTLEEWINIGGIPAKVVDTAGLRKARGLIEHKGIKRTKDSIKSADIILIVIDSARPISKEDGKIIEKVKKKKAILVLNKIDLPRKCNFSSVKKSLDGLPIIETSAICGTGIDTLRNEIKNILTHHRWEYETVLLTARHAAILKRAKWSLKRVQTLLKEKAPEEIMAFEVREGLNALGEVLGESTPDEILDKIFSKFCIGK